MPDVAVVLGNGTVGREHPCFGDVHKALAPPAHGVAGVIAEGLPLADHVGVEAYACWHGDYDSYHSFLINNIKNNDDYKVTLMLLNNENFKATLEITKDYEPDEVEQKLIDQLDSSLKQRTVGRVMTEGGQRGTPKLTIYDTDTNKIVAAKVYQKTDSLNLIKD